MDKIKEKTFWDIYHDNDSNILEFHWKNIGEDINQSDFKAYLLEVVDLLDTYKVRGFLVDASRYHAVIPPELQDWHNEVIIPAYLKAGIEMIVFILNEEDLVVSLSIEQSFDEDQDKANTMKTHFIDDIEKGRELLQQLAN